MNANDKRKKVQQLYKKIPKLQCKGLCHESCANIFLSQDERSLLIEELGYDPFVMHTPETITEALLAGKSSPCPMLTDDKKCSIYALRPLICRLYGTTKRLKCEHGCKPLKWLADIKAKKLIAKLGEP